MNDEYKDKYGFWQYLKDTATRRTTRDNVLVFVLVGLIAYFLNQADDPMGAVQVLLGIMAGLGLLKATA